MPQSSFRSPTSHPSNSCSHDIGSSRPQGWYRQGVTSFTRHGPTASSCTQGHGPQAPWSFHHFPIGNQARREYHVRMATTQPRVSWSSSLLQDIGIFLDLRAKASESSVSTHKGSPRSGNPDRRGHQPSKPVTAFTANATDSPPNCIVCGTSKHPLYACKSLSLEKMLSTLRDNNYCQLPETRSLRS